jgi:hypothetical protein
MASTNNAPKKDLTLQKFAHCAISGNWEDVDLSTINHEQVNQLQLIKKHKYSNLIGLAAQAKTLHKFPRELINPEGLTKKNHVNETAIHFATDGKQIEYIPQDLLTSENISQCSMDGTSPIHYAIINLCLDKFPTELLTSEVLQKVNKTGLSALDFAVFCENELSKANPNEKRRDQHKIMYEQVSLIISKMDTEYLTSYTKNTKLSKVYREKLTTLIDREIAMRTAPDPIEEKYVEIRGLHFKQTTHCPCITPNNNQSTPLNTPKDIASNTSAERQQSLELTGF